MNDDDTQPGLTKDADGTIGIGPAASKASQERSEKEAFDYGKEVIEGINAETSDPNAQSPTENGGASG